MNLRYLLSLAILLWGVRTGQILFAIPMAIIFEAQFFTDRRWALTRQDFYRVADLTTIGMVGMLLFLFLNRADYHFITALTQWLPILFYPLVIVFAYSTTERMPLDVLFYSLRRQREPVTQSWDMSYVFFGLCLVSSGTTRDGETWYLVAAAVLIFLALYRLRSRRYSTSLWVLFAMSIFLAGTLGHQSIRATHLEVKEITQRWLAQFIERRTNPLKTKSAIGAVGKLKASDEILFRVQPLGAAPPPRLLQEATYDSPSGTDWLVLNPQFTPVPPIADFTWRFAERTPGEYRAKIFLEFDRESALVPVPAGVREIFDLPAVDLKVSRFGSVSAGGLVTSPGYEIAFQQDSTINSEPDRSDTFVPPEYQETMASLLPTAPNSADEARLMVYQLFQDYQYSLYQNVPRHEDPLVHFLTEGRAGHCEYFASAAVLALRQLGVPARYAVGYSVQEYDETIDMYIVRKRHAHAWALAWIDDRWQIVDTTPVMWQEAEAAQAGALRPVIDYASNMLFLLQIWWSEQRLEDYEMHLYVIGAILVIVLLWRIATSDQVRVGRDSDGAGTRHSDYPGLDSPFFDIERTLAADGYARYPGEPFEKWVERIGHPDLREPLLLHNRIRFDPGSTSPDVRSRLRTAVDGWLRQYAANRSNSASA